MMTRFNADVIVVGAGIAGSTTARLLAHAGHQVILLDRACFPRDKPCGEGIMPTGVRLLDRWGLLDHIPPARRHPIRGVRFCIGQAASVQGDFPDVGEGHRVGFGVRRLLLDEVLLRHTQSHPNVSLHLAERATDVRRVANSVEVISDRNQYQAKLVVGADGIRSLVRRKLQFPSHRGRRQRFGVRAHFQLPPGRQPEDYVTVRLEHGVQCYTTPVAPSQLQVSLLFERSEMRSFAGRLEQRFDELLRRFMYLRPLLADARRISPVLACGPFDVSLSRRVADRAVLVGDAGGYLDPITGEGISLGLQGAEWAAKTIDNGLRQDELSANRLAAYDQRFARATADYRRLTRAVLAISRRPQLSAWFVRKLSRCPDLYSKLLGINCGVLNFRDLTLSDGWRFLFSTAPIGSALPTEY